MSRKRCPHNAGWYIRSAELMASPDGDELTILADVTKPGPQVDKALATCNAGCGASRNVYLKSVDFKFGKVRPPKAEGAQP
jgi:hypothetical protein